MNVIRNQHLKQTQEAKLRQEDRKMLQEGHLGSVTSRPSEGRDVTENHADYMEAHGLVVLGNTNHDTTRTIERVKGIPTPEPLFSSISRLT